MLTQTEELRALALGSLWLSEQRQWWFPGKYATLAAMKQLAGTDEFAHELAGTVSLRTWSGDPTVPPPTLAQLVAIVFDTFLLLYRNRLPFNGWWVERVRDFVLQYLDQLLVPKGLVYQGLR